MSLSFFPEVDHRDGYPPRDGNDSLSPRDERASGKNVQ